MLKRNGQVQLLKVVARGPGVIPVLEVRKKANSGGLTKWEVPLGSDEKVACVEKGEAAVADNDGQSCELYTVIIYRFGTLILTL